MNSSEIIEKKARPFVFVRCLTYNHEKYIEDALKGFAMQKTDFPFLAVVIDDCSTDGTADIVRRYEMMYPDKIKGIYLPYNYRSAHQDKRPLYQEYVDKATYKAECEGDDYWTDPLKLQKQVDLLESHPDYQMVFHNAIIHYEDGSREDSKMKTFQSGTFSTAQIFELWQLPIASVVYRKELETSDAYLKYGMKGGGLSRFLAASQMGKVYGMSECMSVYRKHEGGMSATMSLAVCMKADNALAIVTGDKEAIAVRRQRSVNALIQYMPAILLKRKEADGLWKAACDFNRWIPYQALLLFVIRLPKYIVKKVFKK